MAYLDDPTHTRKRIAGLSGVALVHLVLAFGLATGLTITGFRKEKDEPIPTVFIDVPTPIPTRTPDVLPTETATRILPTAPDTPIETTIDFPDRDIVDRVVPTVPDIGTITMPTTVPTTVPTTGPTTGPTIAPRSAVP